MTGSAPDISIIGLPESGKTTLLAATWHMVREAGSTTALKFDKLSQGNYEHLNELAKRWRQGKKQQRTQTSGLKVVTMRLKHGDGRSVAVSFPDMPGEDFSGMWEERELDEATADAVNTKAILLVVNGDTIKFPAWVVQKNKVAAGAGLDDAEGEIVQWSADLTPTQVQVVALLQFLMSGDLRIGPRRLAVLISAWDEVEGEGIEPEALIALKLPLLDQYLRSRRDPWDWKVWGLSAQGGVYEDLDSGERLEATEALRYLDRASDRIKVVDGTRVSTDITIPLEWLIG